MTDKTNNAMNGNCAPPDWSYNPSASSERLPIVGLATVGFLIALYPTRCINDACSKRFGSRFSAWEVGRF